MSTWLFDLGNTRLKGAPLQADGSLGDAIAIPHGEGDAWLQGLPSGDVACIASVAADAVFRKSRRDHASGWARRYACWAARRARFIGKMGKGGVEPSVDELEFGEHDQRP